MTKHTQFSDLCVAFLELNKTIRGGGLLPYYHRRKGDTMARIPSGMRKNENGLFEKRFTVNGKRYSAYGHTVKECTDNETEIREAIKAGLYSSNKNITLDAYFDEWEKSRIGVVKNSSINETRSKYDNNIKQALGKKKIQKI